MILSKYHIAAIAIAVFIGGYLTGKGRQEVKTVTQVVHDVVTVKEEAHTKTKIVTIKTPSGKEKTVTIIDSDTTTHTDEDDSISTVVVAAPQKHPLNISALVAVDVKSPFAPVYGVSISKEVVGPVTAGLFGLSNGTVGLSLGINF